MQRVPSNDSMRMGRVYTRRLGHDWFQ